MGHFSLLFDTLDDPRAQHLEQARHHHHDRGFRLFDIAGKLFQALRIIDLRAQSDREELPPGMFISVAERQEGEEYLVIPTEIFRDNLRGTGDIVQDRAMVLSHAARCAAGAAGVDDAG